MSEMSNEKQETIADSVRGMLTLGLLDEKSTDKIPRSLQALGLRTYADRIEAAAKREREAGAEAAQICGEIGEMIGRDATCKETVTDCHGLGNAAAMRESLDKLLGLFDSGLVEYSDSCDNSDTAQIQYVIDKAGEALEKPPRNCDVGTPDEQCERHNRWCYHERNKECAAIECVLCFAKWAQMPYEEGVSE